METDAERLLDRFRRAGRRYAIAAAEHAKLDLMRHSVIAMLMRDAESAGQKTAAAQERDARASQIYRDHIDKIAKAVLELEEARAEMAGSRFAIDLYRTTQASLRQERDAYNA